MGIGAAGTGTGAQMWDAGIAGAGPEGCCLSAEHSRLAELEAMVDEVTGPCPVFSLSSGGGPAWGREAPAPEGGGAGVWPFPGHRSTCLGREPSPGCSRVTPSAVTWRDAWALPRLPGCADPGLPEGDARLQLQPTFPPGTTPSSRHLLPGPSPAQAGVPAPAWVPPFILRPLPALPSLDPTQVQGQACDSRVPPVSAQPRAPCLRSLAAQRVLV